MNASSRKSKENSKVDIRDEEVVGKPDTRAAQHCLSSVS